MNADLHAERHDPRLVDAIGRAILDTVDGNDQLALITRAADAERASRELLQQSVSTARASGQSWAAIGSALGMSRQAVQQRFGDRSGDATFALIDRSEEQRWLGPVTAFDEMPELEIAGRKGWHTVRAAMLRHLMVLTPTQWEHKRVIWTGSMARYKKDGWQVGAVAFPWIYLIRDTGLPAQS